MKTREERRERAACRALASARSDRDIRAAVDSIVREWSAVCARVEASLPPLRRMPAADEFRESMLARVASGESLDRVARETAKNLDAFERVAREAEEPGGWVARFRVDGPRALGGILVTAARREQQLQDAPAAISVVNAAEFERRAAISQGQEMIGVPGVNFESAYEGTYGSVQIRGTPSEHHNDTFVALVDGIPFVTNSDDPTSSAFCRSPWSSASRCCVGRRVRSTAAAAYPAH